MQSAFSQHICLSPQPKLGFINKWSEKKLNRCWSKPLVTSCLVSRGVLGTPPDEPHRRHLGQDNNPGRQHRQWSFKRVTSIMKLPMPQLVSPAVNVGIVLIAVLITWMLTYMLDWLRILEAGIRAREQTPLLEDPTSLETHPFPSIFGPAEKYISLIIPAYNEEARLSSTLDETLQYLQDRAKHDRAFTYEIVIVDDGSTDNTVKVAFEYVKKYKLDVVRVIKQGVNLGKGAAVRKGMLCSRGHLLLMLDADGATKITELEKLENEMKLMASKIPAANSSARASPASTASSPSKVLTASSVDRNLGQVPVTAFGSRAHLEKQAIATRSWYRNVLMKGFHVFVLLVAGPGVRDTQCGFKMFTRSAARQLFLNMRLKRFSFDVELVYLCKRLRIPVLEVAVIWQEIPGSKVKLSSIVHMAFELALIRLGYGFHIWKIHQKAAED
ncbi:unnamed protein product [Calypogeia fissa]